MKRPHPADAAEAALIPKASAFVASLFLGTGRYDKRETKTLAEARTEAIRLTAEHRNGRIAVVYAILPDGRQALVPNSYQPPRPPKAPRAKSISLPKGARVRSAQRPTSVRAQPLSKRAAIIEAARAGKLPPVPDFSAPTHARFRKKLDEAVALVKAADVKALKAFEINPVSTSPKAIARYRDLAVIALQAR